MSRISTNTVITIGGIPFTVVIDRSVPRDEIRVEGQSMIDLLGEAADEEARLAARPPHPAAQVAAAGHMTALRETRERTQARPTNERGNVTGFAKYEHLGGTHDEQEAAYRARGTQLVAEQRTVFSMSLTGQSEASIAKDLGISPYRVAHIRRAAARALGFTPKGYPSRKRPRRRKVQTELPLNPSANGTH